MMLRSASTPSLVSSFTETSHAPPPPAAHGQLPCTTPAGVIPTEIRQRAQSAGNLEEIFNLSFHADGASSLSRQSSKRLSRMNTLEAIPAFHAGDGEDGGGEEDDEEEEEEEEGDSSQLFTVQNLAARELNGFCDMGTFGGQGKMYLAAGIGIGFLDEGGFGGRGGGGGGSCRTADDYGDGGNSRGVGLETHYKNMLLECPGNPLFLRNYAYFLHQTKGDLVKAEEYYSRAILADPEDGEILCGYGKVIWELYGDKERARSYFERALHASSHDSNISASYASFLWDLGEEEDEDEEDIEEDVKQNVGRNPTRFMHRGIMASATA